MENRGCVRNLIQCVTTAGFGTSLAVSGVETLQKHYHQPEWFNPELAVGAMGFSIAYGLDMITSFMENRNLLPSDYKLAVNLAGIGIMGLMAALIESNQIPVREMWPLAKAYGIGVGVAAAARMISR